MPENNEQRPRFKVVRNVEEAVKVFEEIMLDELRKMPKMLADEPPNDQRLSWKCQPAELVGVPLVCNFMGHLTSKGEGPTAVPEQPCLYEVRGNPGADYYVTYGDEYQSVTLWVPSAHDAFILVGALSGHAPALGNRMIGDVYTIVENQKV